ncbi:MAG: YiiX family permuted papain-like enzyme [Bacteroidota bacterium]|nr:YiiX family permuted papain-like enzyme [Bacteroidota bacterium]
MKKNKFLVIVLTISIAISIGVYVNHHYFQNKLQKIFHSGVNEIEFAEKGLLRDGDLIFQTSGSNQSQAIQLATGSKYSHCGIIYNLNGAYFVFEAIQPVTLTPLNKWIGRGEKGHYVVKRLKKADLILTPEVLQKMKQKGEEFKGKNYDLYFEWSDEKIYCSELIWKIYKHATGLEIGKLEQLKDFDLSNNVVKEKMKERYGEKIPLEELVISPARIFHSDLLEIVKEN